VLTFERKDAAEVGERLSEGGIGRGGGPAVRAEAQRVGGVRRGAGGAAARGRGRGGRGARERERGEHGSEDQAGGPGHHADCAAFHVVVAEQAATSSHVPGR